VHMSTEYTIMLSCTHLHIYIHASLVLYVRVQRRKWAREHCLIQASLGGHKSENIMFELRTRGEVCHLRLPCLPYICQHHSTHSNQWDCMHTDTHTHTHTQKCRHYVRQFHSVHLVDIISVSQSKVVISCSTTVHNGASSLKSNGL